MLTRLKLGFEFCIDFSIEKYQFPKGLSGIFRFEYEEAAPRHTASFGPSATVGGGTDPSS